MTRDDRHRRANEEQIRVLREELQGQAPRAWLVPALAGAILAAVVALYLSIGGPLLALVLAGTVCVTVAALLERDGWALVWRWAAGITAGVAAVVFLAR